MSLFRPRQSLTLSQILQAGLADAYARNRAPRAYKAHIPHLLAHFGPERAASTITPECLEAYQVQALARWTPNTVRHQLAFLSRSLTLAVRCGKLQSNPVARMRIVRPGEHRRIFVHQEQIPELYKALGELDREIVTLFIYTGLRRGEAFALLRNEVNWTNREIWVSRSKNGKPRAVAIHPGLISVIQALQARHGTPYVLPGSTNRVSASEAFRQRFKRACVRAGMSNLHIHDLRHTAATWLQEAGAPLPVIRDFLGHSTCRMTEIYANVSGKAMRLAVEAVPWLVPN